MAAALGVWSILTAMRSGDHSLDRLRASGVIRIGYADEAPYAFLDSKGSVTGESPEIAKRISAALGLKRIEWRLTEFDHLLEDLNEGRVDVIAAGMFITPERARLAAFSTPTFQVQEGLLVRKGNPLALHSYEDLALDKTARVAAVAGAVEVGLLLRAGVRAERIEEVPDAQTGLVAVNTGLVDGLALSMPTVRWMALRQGLGRAEVVPAFRGPLESDPAQGAFVFRKRDRQLREAWNAALESYLGSPGHLAVIAPFGFTREDLPEAARRNGSVR